MRMVLTLGLLLTMVSTASAQAPRVELFGSAGYSLSEGIKFPGTAVMGNVYNELDLEDGVYYGAGIGFFANRNVEVGFLWDYQQTSVVARGNATRMSIADTSIQNYHGVVMYNFGSPLDPIRPVLIAGLGSTYLGGFRNLDGEAKFSSIWGAGVKWFPGERFGLQFDIKWTPTYVKSQAEGYWCDPYWGCGTISDPDYVNQWKFGGTLVARF